jgi:SnoaL-like domain
MSRETTEVVRRAYDAFNRGDLEAVFADAGMEFEYVATGVIPGAGGVYRGVEQYRQFMERWWGEFVQPNVQVHELAMLVNRCCVRDVPGPWQAERRGDHWSLWQLWTTRNGKVMRGQGFTNREDALEAAGIGE